MAVVYVKESCAVDRDGGPISLKRGQAWDADADLVREYPDLFEGEPAKIRGRIERATNAPGEKRAVGRPRTTKPEE